MKNGAAINTKLFDAVDHRLCGDHRGVEDAVFHGDRGQCNDAQRGRHRNTQSEQHEQSEKAEGDGQDS